MGFETLLGNDQLKQNLSVSLGKGHISHFYLLCGPRGSGKHTLARLLAAAILCREPNSPCLHCRVCRKILDGNHPDFITVDDPEEKNVSIDRIRQARADIYIQPNESDHKIYLFPRAQDMGLPSQNALLKVLEEPPKYGVFILLIDNPDKLLPTVRSRCTQLRLQALPPEVLRPALAQRFPKASPEDLDAAIGRSGGFLGQAQELLSEGTTSAPQTEELVKSLVGRDAPALLEVLVPLEKWKRDALVSLLSNWEALMENALVCRSGGQVLSAQARLLASHRSAQELMDFLSAIRKAMDYTQGNVSPAAVCGYLQWALR